MSSWVYAVALAIIASVTLLVALDKVTITDGMAFTLFSAVGSFLTGLFLPQPRIAQAKAPPAPEPPPSDPGSRLH